MQAAMKIIATGLRPLMYTLSPDSAVMHLAKTKAWADHGGFSAAGAIPAIAASRLPFLQTALGRDFSCRKQWPKL